MERHVSSLKQKANTHNVTRIGFNKWTVVSGRSGNEYTVVEHDGSYRCNCRFADPYQSGNSRISGCSHVLAVVKEVNAETGRKVSIHSGEEAARRQHRPMVDLGQELFVTVRR